MSLSKKYLMFVGIIFALFSIVFFVTCKKKSASPSNTDVSSVTSPIPVVYTVNYPLYYFAMRIAGDNAEIIFSAPSGCDPAFWQPEPDVIRDWQKADLILLNGASYAKWIEKASLPNARMVNTSAAFSDRYLSLKETTVHSHGPKGKHEHGSMDFNTWVDPLLAQQQAKAVHKALLTLLPEEQLVLGNNFMALKRDLIELDQSFKQLLSQTNTPIIASHPVYNYFARRYQLNLESLHWEPDQMPEDTEWESLEKWNAAHLSGIMIWEASPSGAIQERLQQLGITYLVFDPCGNTPAQGDYLSVMQENIMQLQFVIK